jgi:hypothetical protein
MADVMSFLRMTAPGMWATAALVLVALAALLWRLGEHSWRTAMRHHDEALERERAAALAEDVEQPAPDDETALIAAKATREKAR